METEQNTDTEAMYWCIKCDKRHRRSSMIGSWHEPLELPEIDKSRAGRSRREKLEKSQYAAAIALGLAMEDLEKNEVKFEEYQQRYRGEGFADIRNARDAIYSLRDEFHAIINRRHSGHEWLAFEASGNTAMRLREAAKEYKRLGMSFGVRHEP